MSIDDYNWNELYKKANDFLAVHIPVARVNTGTKTLMGTPRVEFSFAAKGNANYVKLLDEMECIRRLKGSNDKNGRIIRAEIIFNEDGSLN